MSRTRIIGEVEVKEIEWEIPNFLSRFAGAKDSELSSDLFTFAGESWNLKIRAFQAHEGYCFGVYLLRKKAETSCSMQCRLGFKKGGQIQDVIEDVHVLYTAGSMETFFPILQFWEDDLEQRWSVLQPTGVLTLVFTLWKGDLADDMAEGSNYTCRTVTRHTKHPVLLQQIGSEVKEGEWSIKTDEKDVAFAESDAFSFAGGTWHFHMTPQRETFDISLIRKRRETDCSLQYSFGIKKTDGEIEAVAEGNVKLEKFSSWATIDISIRRGAIRKRIPELIHPPGVLILAWTLRKEDETAGKTETGTEKLSSDMKQLMLSGDESDFTVQVQGEEFRLHRSILGARTPVFGSMLRSEMKEKSTGCVCIDDCEPGTFREFVRYVYTGRLDELSTDTVFGLYAVADKYQADDLKSACLGFVRRTISEDTFVEAVNLALTYGLKDILSHATDYYVDNTKAIIQTVKWMNFMTENPIEANELYLKALCKMTENKDA